ncbi:TonB C-terminal domain-containing protein [Myroides sp. N17-2]|uniref:TonB C-terminal domain-containing protein n=1 Tax=Myroides sp. N17-2 TaxID=2030799 RepID=UPI000EFD4490|nr:TonB C-terminal domain-containing protein [Myroides sp. N17-2]
MNGKYIALTVAVLSMAISYAQKKTVIPAHTPKSATVCARSNTDTIEFTHNKDFKPAHSRIATNQLSINFSKHFTQAFPEKPLSNNASVIFELQIETDGSISSVSILRSGFKSEYNDKLKEIVRTVTADTWSPATYKGSKIRSQYTLPITIFANVNEL